MCLKIIIASISICCSLYAEPEVVANKLPYETQQQSFTEKIKVGVKKGADETKHFFTETTPAAFKYAGEKMKVGYQKTGDFFEDRVWPTLQQWGHAIADSKANPRNW